MPAFPPLEMKMSARVAQKTMRCGTTQLIAVGVLGTVACVALLSIVIGSIWRRGRTKELSAQLDNATAELGVQPERVLALEGEVGWRDSYILRNMDRAPRAYSATPGKAHPKPSRPAEGRNEMAAVASEGEGDERALSVPGVAGGTLRLSTPIPVIRVQPGEIKTITLQPRRLQSPRAVSLDETSFKASRDAEGPLKAHQGDGREREASLDATHPVTFQTQDSKPKSTAIGVEHILQEAPRHTEDGDFDEGDLPAEVETPLPRLPRTSSLDSNKSS